VKVFSGHPLDPHDLMVAEFWGKRLAIPDYQNLLTLLTKNDSFTPQDKQEILRFSSLYATKMLEKSGLDLIWDGEQHRVEMYEYAVRRMQGFTFHGHVRSFDNKYYCKASCTHAPSFSEPFHTQEYLQIAQFTENPVKIPITGPYTIMDWSYDEHYLSSVIPGKENVKKLAHQARQNFLNDVAKKVTYPNIRALYDKGARYIQIDEPAATTKRDEIPEFIQAMKDSIGDLAGKAFFSVHICFSDYHRLFPAILELQGILDEIHFEYANRDTKELGVTADQRVGYEILEKFKDTQFKIGLGVLDVHTDFIEPPELIRDRILYAAKVIGDPNRLYIAPDCGLRTRTWEVAFLKLQNMVEGTRLAERELGLA
jgi:5-methyltetrahydropteroyltriglutamate--homocysteine methyltransferase